jgi:hypothetical protein
MPTRSPFRDIYFKNIFAMPMSRWTIVGGIRLQQLNPGVRMNTSHFFLHLPGKKDPAVVPTTGQVTIGEALALARREGHALPNDAELIVFHEDEDEPVSAEKLPLEFLLQRKSLVCHTCRQIEAKVLYNGGHRDHHFSPNLRLGKVLQWALHAFGIAGPEATGLDLRLDGHPEEDLPENQRIGTLVQHKRCDLVLHLVPKPRVNG